jgi:hypothetical protein
MFKVKYSLLLSVCIETCIPSTEFEKKSQTKFYQNLSSALCVSTDRQDDAEFRFLHFASLPLNGVRVPFFGFSKMSADIK